MYNIYYETDNGNVPIISIEGNLDTVDDISRIIAEVYSINKDNNGATENGKGVVINLSKAKAVSDECLKMFKRLQPVYNLEFQNYSIYIEVVLRDYKLIDCENSEQQKGKII